MAWAFRAVSTTDNGGLGAGTIVINKPTGTVDGDLIEVGACTVDAVSALTLAGWTNVRNDSPGAGNGRMWTLRRIASGEGASWTFTATGGNIFTGFGASYSGVSSTPDDVNGGATGVSVTTLSAPSVTTTAANDLDTRVYMGFNQNTITLDAALTSRANFGTPANGNQLVIGDRNQASAGATGALAATYGASDTAIAHTVTFKAAAAGGGGLPFPMQVELLTGGMQESGGVRQW